MIAVIDYGMGNLRSVAKALESAGANEVRVSSDAGIIRGADKIVLPGVGAIKEAMRELKRLNLIKTIHENIFKKPFLGICLGLQLLFERSEEGGSARGLGVFKGTVRRFPDRLKVPHMGWNQIKVKRQNAKGKTKERGILKNIPDNSFFIFVILITLILKIKISLPRLRITAWSLPRQYARITSLPVNSIRKKART